MTTTTLYYGTWKETHLCSTGTPRSQSLTTGGSAVRQPRPSSNVSDFGLPSVHVLPTLTSSAKVCFAVTFSWLCSCRVLLLQLIACTFRDSQGLLLASGWGASPTCSSLLHFLMPLTTLIDRQGFDMWSCECPRCSTGSSWTTTSASGTSSC